MADDDAGLREFAYGKGAAPPSREQRLRDEFAQMLLAAQRGKAAVPLETLWAMQAYNQWPRPEPDPSLTRPRVMGDSMTTDTPMRQLNPDPTLNFPMDEVRTRNRPKLDELPTPKPFPGAQSVAITPVETKSYRLPKSQKTSKKGKD
jgi:hypothetical protein